ncbi:MAG TPA: FtsW/RodA/SpoVE family cell cycle protein [Desulfobacteria bacterium]|nr:FtsW/RodA/SpoVE family cell cycle protein [Desulfobacteria bacterium]
MNKMSLGIRRVEKGLFTIIFAILCLGIASLFAAGTIKDVKLPLILALLVAIIFIGAHLLLEKWKSAADPYIFPLAAMLSVIGLIMILRLSPDLVIRQTIWILAGLVVFVLTAAGLRDYRFLEEYKYLYIFLGLFLLLSTIIFGTTVGGARSWLNLGYFKFQPSELVKIILVIFLASYLEEKKEILTQGTRSFLGVQVPSLQYIGPLLVMWGFSLILLIFQKDLGAALIFFGSFLAMIFIATGRWSYLFSGTLLFAIGALLCYFLFNHVQVRVSIWLNPWNDIEGKGYQIIQSLFAVGSGGLYGTGLGLGQPMLIPAVHTDFVFSAWAEETGLLGAVALLIIYCLLIYRGFTIALKADNGFGTLLAAGLTTMFAIQTLVIVGGVIKLFPLTGVTLPFVSYGGSSLVSNYILLGLLMNISAKNGA